jgi:Subtilisin-like serine proteases
VEREDDKRASDVGRFTTIGDAAFGYGVTVAVLDTVIYYGHPELYGKLVYCINAVGTRLLKARTWGGAQIGTATARTSPA